MPIILEYITEVVSEAARRPFEIRQEREERRKGDGEIDVQIRLS